MRDIKFRGMAITGAWHYGLLAQCKDRRNHGIPIEEGFYISNSAGMPFAHHVRPETIGQYTGIKDKTGRDIYEGDILRFDGHRYTGIPGKFDKVNMVLPVDFSHNRGFQMYQRGFCHYEIYTHDVEVIGNIYQNPELLNL